MSLHFDETWIDPDQLALTAELAASTHYVTGDAVEIGVHQGRSAIPIAAAIYPGWLHAVDNWSAIDLGEPAPSRDNRAVFLANLTAAGAAGQQLHVQVHDMGWREWLESWDATLRFAHIDAHHTRKEVRDTIAALIPYMAPGGIIAGDDYGKPPVAAGVHDLFPSPEVRGDLWWVVRA